MLPAPSATTHATMASSSEHTKQLLVSTNGKMLIPVASADSCDISQPSFSNLPIELEKIVVYHAEDSCLPNLRLTNKELNAIVTKPFGERLLAERRFMLSEYSLQGLVDLTAHAVLGK